MRDGDVDYSKYTLPELEEARAGINKHQYPKNYENLRSAHERLGRTLPALRQTGGHAVGETEEDEPQPRYDENGRYVPNLISSGDRASFIIFSLLLFAYGSHGVWVNDLYVPGKRSRGVHLHDITAWLMYGAIICACIVMISVVMDHYDRRENERYYRAVAQVGRVFGWILFGVSLLWGLFR